MLVTLFFSVGEAKFTRGDRFQYANIEGALTIQCAGRVKTVSCRDVFMDPWPYDVFVGPRNLNAVNVEFDATVGRDTQTATVEYDGATGRSADVNLGVYSLFQKPLLKVGENNIRYVLLDRNNKVLETNTFVVSVARGNTRTCESRVVSTPNADDCDHPYSLCQVYFRTMDYCR